jgi:hypothetical protein
LGPFKAKNKFPAWILRVSVQTPEEDRKNSKRAEFKIFMLILVSLCFLAGANIE